jgi:hypothetical protein
MIPVAAAAVAFITIFDASGVVGRSEGRHWEGEFGVGAARSIVGSPAFGWLLDVDACVLRQIGAKSAIGAFVEYRWAVHPEPASGISYANIGARGRLAFGQRIWLRLDVGWSFRHISLDDGYANTVGGLSAGGGLAVRLVRRQDWDISVIATGRYTRRPTEPFAVIDLGLEPVWTLSW